jgi:hypothetical protein
MTDAYLAPIQLRSTTLTLIYSTVALPSWSAGSHQVSCSIGATLGNGGWSTLLNSAKGPLVINGQSPVPPPDIPGERLNLPPIPMPPPIDTSSQVSSQADLSDQSQSGQGNQGNAHLPGQSTATNDTTGTGTGTTQTSTAPPPQGNTFLNGPPPAQGPPPDGTPLDAPPPPPGDVPPAPPPGGTPPGGPPPGEPPPGPAPGPVDPAPAPAAPILPPPLPGP